MFSKDPEKMESFLGANSNFKGELNVKGTLRVDGRVEGRLVEILGTAGKPGGNSENKPQPGSPGVPGLLTKKSISHWIS